MTVDEAIEELVGLGLYRQCLRITRNVGTQWTGDGGPEVTMFTSWSLHGRLDRKTSKSNLDNFYFSEHANTLDQIVERLRLELGAKNPGDDKKAVSK